MEVNDMLVLLNFLHTDTRKKHAFYLGPYWIQVHFPSRQITNGIFQLLNDTFVMTSHPVNLKHLKVPSTFVTLTA